MLMIFEIRHLNIDSVYMKLYAIEIHDKNHKILQSKFISNPQNVINFLNFSLLQVS